MQRTNTENAWQFTLQPGRPGFYDGYGCIGYTSNYGGGPCANYGPGGGYGPEQVIAYADGASEAGACAQGFQAGAYGPGIPAARNGGLFNPGAAVNASTYPPTRAELAGPAGIGPATNPASPSGGGANNFQNAQQAPQPQGNQIEAGDWLNGRRRSVGRV